MFVNCGLIITLYYKDPVVTSPKETEGRFQVLPGLGRT